MAAIESALVPATVAKAELDHWFGDSWLSWEPETLWSALKDRKLDVPEGAKAAIQAVRTVLAGDSLFRDPLSFSCVVLGLNNHTPEFRKLTVLSPDELNYALVVVRRLRKIPDVVDDQIISYIRACFAEAGVMAYPPALSFAEPATHADQRNAIRKAAAVNSFDTETMLGVQASKLHDVEVYARSRLAQFVKTASK